MRAGIQLPGGASTLASLILVALLVGTSLSASMTLLADPVQTINIDGFNPIRTRFDESLGTVLLIDRSGRILQKQYDTVTHQVLNVRDNEEFNADLQMPVLDAQYDRDQHLIAVSTFYDGVHLVRVF